jgi:hypothetical protein
MRFQERDGSILAITYEYDGVLARRHLKRMFWPNATLRAALKRLAKLVNDGYLAKPTTHQRRTQPIPEPIYWLDWKGIVWVAGQHNVAVNPPTNTGENQMRKLAKQLRAQGIRWLREPRWIQLAHDLAVVDFRLAVQQAVSLLPALSLEEWRHESEFRSIGETVEYKIKGTDGAMKQVRKRVYPDSYFVIVDTQRLAQGLLARARFLLELDNATHPNNRFGREKVAPGLAYIGSPEYEARFGDNSGRWLVVTTGRVRMRNLMRQTQQVAGAGASIFLFTTFDKLGAGNILTEPVWWQVGREEPIPLLAGD